MALVSFKAISPISTTKMDAATKVLLVFHHHSTSTIHRNQYC